MTDPTRHGDNPLTDPLEGTPIIRALRDQRPTDAIREILTGNARQEYDDATGRRDFADIVRDALEAHLAKPPTTLLLVATEREGTTTLGPRDPRWVTVTALVTDPGRIDHLRITGWLATNTAKQHVDYHIAATHLDERTTP